MLLSAARRIAVMYAALLGGTVVLSLIIGLAAGSSAARSVSVGLYVAGVALFVGCFVMGARGPMRGVGPKGEAASLAGARRVRRATGDERSEATRTAILLFVLGLGLIIVAAVLDPRHNAI